MPSAECTRAISSALQHGRALLKFISPNDAGLTGAHQCGFYLPKQAWRMFTPRGPERGVNHKHLVHITWPDGRITESAVTWYGKAKDEYRLTRFGKEFPFLHPDAVGDLLVLVPSSLEEFTGYVLTNEEDVDELRASLGIEFFDSWGIYDGSARPGITEDECLDGHFEAFVRKLTKFPKGEIFSREALAAVTSCVPGFPGHVSDSRLMKLMEAEFRLFKCAESFLCKQSIGSRFDKLDEFLSAALTIVNRRKSRAGRSLENHVRTILTDAHVPFESQPDIDGRPDFIIPGTAAYNDERHPESKLFVLGLKTTCKDRWRQVLNEAPRLKRKHILTLQQAISSNQLDDMAKANVSLVVPAPLLRNYPSSTNANIRNVETFIGDVKRALEA